MAQATGIEWADATWNPIVGCSLVSPGCTNCYAMRMAARVEKTGVADYYESLTQPSKSGPVWTGKLAAAGAKTMAAPLKRKRPTTYFVNSMGDLFHEAMHEMWIDRAMATMALANWHTFVVLTKRAKRMRAYCSDPEMPKRVARRILQENRLTMPGAAILEALDTRVCARHPEVARWPLPNVVLGVSAEDQTRADERIPDLLATPAATRVVSAEPLLGPINFGALYHGDTLTDALDGMSEHGVVDAGDCMVAINPKYRSHAKLDGVIVGGESGAGARPMHPDWARSIRDQCAAAGVAFHFKQWGEFREFDTGPPPHERIDNDSEVADAIYAAAVRPSFVTHEGRHFARVGLPPETPARLIERVGKKAAGRLLDGREHNDLPWSLRK